MRSRIGVTMVLAVLGAALTCACSSSSGGSPPAEAGSTACSGDLNTVLSSAACPITGSSPSSYDEAITTTCESLNQKTGSVSYGQCFEFLAVEIDVDGSGHNFSKCFYDEGTHALVGVIFADGQQDQCGGSSFTVQAGQVDTTCSVTGPNGGGGYESCAPVSDAGPSTTDAGGGAGG